ncbi:MAG: enolase C-terminal domain-like protein [Phycisphaeraceae bacterium]|jgi:L-fuconate dehydratase|nr:enolase C-terminal domain-like protein [Phycisphaeraceae bacterium]MDP7346964.1 enolase C-terminal domain-like protein [Phycisphaeraceae bacterium]
MSTTITRLCARDIRFRTSQGGHGSDAVHKDPDYSCAYVVLETDTTGLAGQGIAFTLGRGNELVCAGVTALSHLVVGKTLESIVADMRGFCRELTNDSQLRWVGPDKGVIHMSAAAIINAVWDLYGRREGKPVWKLLADMPPRQLVDCVDFRYISDALPEDDAVALLEEHASTKTQREQELVRVGLPSYTTSAGWLGYSDDDVRQRCEQYMARGWTWFKMKVGFDDEQNVRRARLIRETIGDEGVIMIDANQAWEVDETIAHIRLLAKYNLLWIEEPTACDDVLGHARIARAIAPIGVACGEAISNRVLFKQFMQAGAMQFCQIDSCRLAGVNENLAVMLMAAKFGIPVCPHAGGIGLGNYVQHLSAINYIAIAPSLDKVVIEYSDHLNEHFVEPLQFEGARYRLPTGAGYSIKMKPKSLDEHEYATPC